MSQLPQLPRGVANRLDGAEQLLATTEWIDPSALVSALAFEEAATAAQSPVVIGKAETPTGRALLAYDDDRHIVTIAGSRAGKGVSLIVPNLLQYPGSVICIDPKGENAAITAAYRANVLGQKVAVLDPYGVAKVDPALRKRFNPLAMLGGSENSEMIDDAAGLADALVVQGNTNDPHWDESARAFLKGVILFLAANGDANNRPFRGLRELVTLGIGDEDVAPSIEFLCAAMRVMVDDDNSLVDASPATLGVIAAAAQSLMDMGDKERGSVLSTVRRHTEFLDSPQIVDAMEESDFDPRELKNSENGMTIYVVLPEWRIGTHSRWLRLVVNTLLHVLERTPKHHANQPSALLILEEFAALGHMQSIERAAGYIAGFGVKLWSILQDLNQLKDIYKARWETFLGNAGLVTAFGNVDLTTLEYLSKRLGETEVRRTSRSETYQEGQSKSHGSLARKFGELAEKGVGSIIGHDGGSENSGFSASSSEALHKSPLLLPDEIARHFGRERETMLALIAGAPPALVERLIYYDDPLFAGRASPNPYR